MLNHKYVICLPASPLTHFLSELVKNHAEYFLFFLLICLCVHFLLYKYRQKSLFCKHCANTRNSMCLKRGGGLELWCNCASAHQNLKSSPVLVFITPSSAWCVVKTSKTIKRKCKFGKCRNTGNNWKGGDFINLDLNIEEQITLNDGQVSEMECLIEAELLVVKIERENSLILENDTDENQVNFAGDVWAPKTYRKELRLFREQQRE